MTGIITFSTLANGKEKIIKSNFTSCEWESSIDNYCTTANITFPGISRLKEHNYEGKEEDPSVSKNLIIKTGMWVKIECGYDDKNDFQFSGFVVAVNVKKYSNLVVSCEGYSYQLRNKNFSHSYYNASLKKVLQDLVANTNILLSSEIPDVKMEGNLIFEKYKTGIDALNKLKSKCGLTVYFNHNVLYVGLKYIHVGKTVNYKIGWNVTNSDTLVYKEILKTYSIAIKQKNKDGTATLVTSGEGNTTLNINISNIRDKSFLHQIALDKLLDKNPGNYSGEFTTFLKPFIKPTDTAVIYDPQFPERSGKYFVDKVKGSFSDKGGRLIVGLSIKL